MVSYLKGVIREFSYIRWLSFSRNILLTIFIVITSLIIGFVLGAVDGLFATLLRGIVI